MSPSHYVLVADDTVICGASGHYAIRALSYVVVALFACGKPAAGQCYRALAAHVCACLGLPIVFGYVLLKKARIYNRETKGTNATLARRVAEDLEVDEISAEFVIRDVIIGEDYSFLMDACALHQANCVTLCSRSVG